MICWLSFMKKELFMEKNKIHQWGSLYIELTSKCNLKCAYCYNSCGDNDIKYLSCQSVKQLIDAAHKRYIKDISFSGGEPLFHPDFEEIFDYCVSVLGKGPTIITNASLLTENLLEKIVSTRTLLQLTIDGNDAETHGLTRDYFNFRVNMDILDKLKNLYQYKGIFARINLTPLNVDRLIPTTELLIEKGVHSITLALISAVGRGAGFIKQNNLYIPELLRRIKNDVDYLSHKYKEIQFRYADLGNCLGCDFYSDKEYHLNLRIRYDGLIFPCQAFHSDRFSLGSCFTTDIGDDSFYRIFDRWVERALAFRKNTLSCENCFCHIFCMGGCLANIIDNENKQFFEAACAVRKITHKDTLLSTDKA